jgi:hypothetical protein
MIGGDLRRLETRESRLNGAIRHADSSIMAEKL